MKQHKTKVIAVLLMIGVVAAAFGQPYFGGRVPLGYVTADVENLDENRFMTGIEGIGGYRMGGLAVEGKVGYVAHIYSVEILGETVSAFLNYMRFALLGKFYPLDIVYVGAGVEFSYLVGAGVATEDETYNQQIDAQDGPIFVAADAGVELPIGTNLYLPIGAFFNWAVGNIPENTQLIELGVKAGIQYRY